MNFSEISKLRIHNQQIDGSNYKTAKELVGWMGAVQAQDFAMAKWAIGLRLVNSTDQQIEHSYNQGDILRIHLMRPTWHFVSSDDIYWMLELTASKIKSIMKTNDRRFELSDSTYFKTNQIIERQFIKEKHISRINIAKALENEKINLDENRLSHILMRAELDGIICSGPIIDKKLTYCLLEERVPNKKNLTRDIALAELANKYFTSHCPATVRDFIWWSGLSVTEARIGLEMVKSNFISETIDSETYWFTQSSSDIKLNLSAFLLPAFDEFLISYANRSASLLAINNKKTFSNNGIFRPVIVVNGQVDGLWKRTLIKNKVILETDLFHDFTLEIKNVIEKESKRLELFLDKKLELIFHP
jgi:hypothetical protein